MVTVDPAATVRLLISDTDPGTTQYFTDTEIATFLALESDNVKRAAAQALDTIASNETLVAKWIQDHSITVDGTKVAADLRKAADALRAQATDDEARAGDEGFFEIIPPDCGYGYGYDGCW